MLYDKIGRGSVAAESQVGIFWMVLAGGLPHLLAASCPVSEAEPYGDCQTFGPGHYDIWSGWRRSRTLEGKFRAVAVAYEYEDWPRGRVVFDRAQNRFVLYTDRKLMRPDILSRIAARFLIPLAMTIVAADAHYRSVEEI